MKTIITSLIATALLGTACTSSSAQAAKPANAPRKPALPDVPEPPQPAPAPPAGPESKIAWAAAEAQLKGAQTALDQIQTKMFKFPNSRPRRALIIPGSEGEAGNASAIQEDMSVMSRILEKAASPEQHRGGSSYVGSPWIMTSSREARDMFVAGYGALFFLNVNFPLAAPANETEGEASSAPANEWDQTKKELYEPPANDFVFQLAGNPGRAEEFKPEKVDDLKARIVSALTNATHLRQLKAEEFVTVVVTGATPAAGRKIPARKLRTAGEANVSAPAKTAEENQLIFRVRRRDIEALANGSVTPEAFRQSVTITSL